MQVSLNIVNADTATFECTFGRGCEGLCCKNGRPSVTPAEKATMDSVLHRALPLMRPEARKMVEKEGYLSKRIKVGHPMMKVSKEYCVFFNKGCVLHTIGAEDGESYQYKPEQCALFPLEEDERKKEWYIRQWNVEGEQWDLFCLNPKNSKLKAAESLKPEIELAARIVERKRTGAIR